jgi:hypothetical protein
MLQKIIITLRMHVLNIKGFVVQLARQQMEPAASQNSSRPTTKLSDSNYVLICQ